MSGAAKAKPSRDALAVASRALALVRKLDREVERKHYQVNVTTTNYLAGVVSDVSGVAQGIAADQRIGEAIRLQHVSVRGRVGVTTSSNMAYRFLLFADKRQVSGSAPTVTTVLTQDATTSQLQPQFDGRWLILKDETLFVNNYFLNQDNALSFRYDIPVNNLPLEFNAAGGHSKNGIYLLVIADLLDNTSPTVKPAISDAITGFTFDLTYTDA